MVARDDEKTTRGAETNCIQILRWVQPEKESSFRRAEPRKTRRGAAGYLPYPARLAYALFLTRSIGPVLDL